MDLAQYLAIHPDESPVKPRKKVSRTQLTPGKSRVAGFNRYFEREKHLLSMKYPFLTGPQIKNKAAEKWKKLSADEKKQFQPFRWHL